MKLFETTRNENRKSRLYRFGLNVWPCIWCTGGKIDFVSGDFQELHVSLKLNIRTRNRVGTVYGGSIYSSIDPYFMLMLMQILGKNYVVWDKGCNMKFVKPIVERVKCRFLLDDETIKDIKHHIELRGEYSFDLPLHYEDDHGKVYAVFTKSVYAADKEFYKRKLEKKAAADGAAK